MKRFFKIIGIIIFFSIAGAYYLILNVSRSEMIEVSGKAPKGYDLVINTLYRSESDSCSKSDWNTGGSRKEITHIKEKIKYKNGKYYTTFSQKIKKNFCSWNIIYNEINLIYKQESDKPSVETDTPTFRMIVRPISKNSYNKKSVKPQNNIIKEQFICAREDSLKTDWSGDNDTKHIITGLICTSKNSKDSNSNESTLQIAASYSELTKMALDFEIKNTIYCFVKKRDCPLYAKGAHIWDIKSALAVEAGNKKEKPKKVYTYTVDKKSRRALYHTIDLDSYEFNLTKAKELLDKNSSLITDRDNLFFQRHLAGSFSNNNINFETLKLLYAHGYDLSKHKNEIYLENNINKIIESFDIEPSYSIYWDFNELPQVVKNKLQENNITLENYYPKKRAKQSLLYEIGASRNDRLEITKWLLAQGFKTDKADLEWALVGALRYNEFKDTAKVISEYINLGANLKNKDVAFPLMETMRRRFDDIDALKTLVDAGVNINARDEYGSSILFYMNYKLGEKYRSGCSIEHNKETIKEYIKLGADINHKNRSGETIIQDEIRDHSTCNIKALEELGALK